MRALIALAASASLVGCAIALGGLEEGRSRASASASDAGDGGEALEHEDADLACDGGWPPGSHHRAVFEVTSTYTSTLTDYTLPLSLDTRLLIARGWMRADGTDLRVTTGDEQTSRRFLLPQPVASEAARLWMRLDVPPGKSRIYVYFGGPAAVDEGLHRDVFFDGIVPPFDPTTGAWRTDSALCRMADGGATVRLAPADANLRAGWCTTVDLPQGHGWQIVFDLRPGLVTAPPHFSVLVDGVACFETKETKPLPDAFTHRYDGLGIPPGPGQEICFSVGVRNADEREGAELEATFSSPRLRVFGLYPPKISPLGIEDAPCRR